MPKQTKLSSSFISVLVSLLLVSYAVTTYTYAKDDDSEDSNVEEQNSEDSSTETPEPKEMEEENENENEDVDDDNSENLMMFKERIQTEVRERETEMEQDGQDGDKQKIQIESKDGKTKIEINKNGVKIKYEYEDGRLRLHAENENGESIELGDDALGEIEDSLDDDSIRVATQSGERFILRRGSYGAITSLPVSVDFAANTLVVTTPEGDMTITLLPDMAIANLVQERVLSRVEGDETGVSLEERVRLTYEDGVVKYVVRGKSSQKLLGVFSVEIDREVELSSVTGEVINVNQNLINRILDLISI